MLNKVSTTEVRTTLPTYYAPTKGETLHVAVMKGRGHVFSPERLKVTRLANGDVSIRGLGKGGRRTIYVKASTYVLIVDSGQNLAHGAASSLV